MKNVELGNGSVPKLLLRLALPAVVAQIINMLYNLVDRIYVGRIPEVGTAALAGLGVCFPLLIIVAAFACLAGMGGAPLAAIKLGENRRADAEKIFNNAFVLLIGFGVVLTVVLLLFSRQLLVLFGSPTASLPYGDAYMRIYAIGTVFVLLSLGLNTYISTQGYALTSMLTVAIGAVLNIALDPLFIFVFNMGVEGAALATVLSQAVSCIWVVCFFLSKRSQLRIRPRQFVLKKKIVLPMLALGVSPFIMQATESAIQIVFNVQLFHYTDGNQDYTAALTIMLSVMQMIVLPINGMGTGAQPLISYNYGAGKIKRVTQTIKCLLITAFVTCTAVWVVSLTVPSVFARLFSATPSVTALVQQYMPLFMMGSVLFCLQFTFQNTFVALGQSAISLLLALLRKVFLLIPLTFILPLFIGIRGIFVAEGVADVLASLTTCITFLLLIRGILRRRTEKLAKESALENAANGCTPCAEPEQLAQE